MDVIANHETMDMSDIVLQAIEPQAAERELLDMDKICIDPSWAMRVPASLALRRQVLPFACADGQVYVACADPADRSSPRGRRAELAAADLCPAGRRRVASPVRWTVFSTAFWR